MGRKVIIVGGVAGGASAAARLRRLDEDAEIVLFERDDYISFANCGLPYYIGETIKDRDNLLVQTPESMNQRFQIDVRVNSEVVAIDSNTKTVKVNSHTRGEYTEHYDQLVLSPGAKAIRPNIEGIDHSKIFTLRNIADTDRIKSWVDESSTDSAIVIGGGYVGIEMAENLKHMGLAVTLVEAAPHILAPFDTDLSVLLEAELIRNGVKLVLNDGVSAFADQEELVQVTLNSGTQLAAKMVILAIGVVPDTSFLNGSGIALGARGHIIVNEKMQTNIDGIYAVGDAIEVIDFVTKQISAIPLAGPANKQGRIAADNIAGLDSIYKGTQGSAILKVFNLTGASTGSNERTLTRLGIPHQAITVHPVSHASYYPAPKQMTLKLIFDADGKILGAQGVGAEGVDKRIDVIATAIRFGGTVYDLEELELCYAPPFSSAKDPVNMAGFVAENVLKGKMDVITTEQLQQQDLNDKIFLDVRTQAEFENGHLAGAQNIPVDELRRRLNELDQSKEIIEYCQVGLRGYIAARILKQHGYKVKNVTGGYKSASTMGFKLIQKPTETLSIDADTQTIKK